MTRDFDLIVAGAGLGGLSFLWHLLEAGGPERRVFGGDRTFRADDDRTWCFWGPEDAPLASLAVKSWSDAEVCVPGARREASLGPLSYHCVPSGRFRRHILERIERTPWITRLEADVHDLGEDERGPFVETSRGRFRGAWILQSLRFLGQDADRVPRYPVRQHFGGLEVRTVRPVFEPGRFTLMDFRVPQRGGTAFVYVLPFEADRALVEHTMFSTDPLSAAEHEAAVAGYLRERFDVPFEVLRREYGNIPMDDRFPSQRAHPRVFNIGIVGGQIKPSTGYTFARVQRHAKVLAEGFAADGCLRIVPEGPGRFRFYDQLLLRILHDEPWRSVTVFQRLLFGAPLPRVLRFLDEQTRVSEEMSLFWKLPSLPFVRGIPTVVASSLSRYVGGIGRLPIGLGVACTVFVCWLAAFAIGLGGLHPGAGGWLGDLGWVALQTFLSTGVFITAHEAMHGLVVPGNARANRVIGWIATWSYAGLDFDVLRRAHHEHHARPATADDPDFHSGNPNIVLWYLDFMRQYLSVRQLAWMGLVWSVLVYVLGLGTTTVWVFWAIPLMLSTLQLFIVGTWLVHRPGRYLGEGHLRARSFDVHPFWSFLACYHFGYHFEHHARPDLPWWRLSQVRGLRAAPPAVTESL